MNRYIGMIVFFFLLQLLLFDHFYLFDHSKIILFYVGFLFLPYTLSNMMFLIIVFLVSMLYDWIHLHLGLVTSILLILLLGRKYWIRVITPPILLENPDNFDLFSQSFNWYAFYIMPFVILFNIVYEYLRNMEIEIWLTSLGILNGLIVTVIGFFLSLLAKKIFSS